MPHAGGAFYACGSVKAAWRNWSGQLGENQGRVYLDDAAVNYDKTAVVGPAALVEKEWYEVAVRKISLVCKLDVLVARRLGGGEALPLSFDAATIFQMGGLARGSKEEFVTLGLSLWAFYYIVLDITARSVSFIPQEPGTEALRSAIQEKFLAEAESLGPAATREVAPDGRAATVGVTARSNLRPLVYRPPCKSA
ncbi:unnamed protein product [Symbiodinium sp. CCMP2592]|nr:unnamed protein product [Symbiodinium sp. CCMP2592]